MRYWPLGPFKYVVVLGQRIECHGRLLHVEKAVMVLSESNVVALVHFFWGVVAIVLLWYNGTPVRRHGRAFAASPILITLTHCSKQLCEVEKHTFSPG